MNRHPKSLKSRSGMTLIEVMISAVILGSVLVSSMTATSQAILASEKNRDMGRAVDWMEAEVEYLRSITWDELDAMTETSSFTQPKPHEKYLSKRDIADRKTDQKVLKLVVFWNDSRGRYHSTTSATFINKDGI